MSSRPGIRLRDSITQIGASEAGCVLVNGSHGGVYTGNLAARARLRAAVFNDAGVGKDGAGIAGLAYLDDLGVAAAAVGFESARIGDAEDMWARGVISYVNAAAARLGCAPGQSCAACAALLEAAPPRPSPPPSPPGANPPDAGEASHLISATPGEPEVWALDSVSLVGPEHRGQIVLTGSHGGLPGGRPEAALKVDALAAVYNDAGIGIDQAGIGRLPALDRRNIAAATVAAASARIGDGLSTYRDGVISRVNRTAAAAGAVEGMTTAAFVACIIADLARK